jgi:hypothetical protein
LISFLPVRRLAAVAIVPLIAAGCDQRQVPVAATSPTGTIPVQDIDAVRKQLRSCWYLDAGKV